MRVVWVGGSGSGKRSRGQAGASPGMHAPPTPTPHTTTTPCTLASAPTPPRLHRCPRRYTAVRRQSSPGTGAPELQVLDYDNVQQALLPLVTQSYALVFMVTVAPSPQAAPGAVWMCHICPVLLLAMVDPPCAAFPGCNALAPATAPLTTLTTQQPSPQRPPASHPLCCTLAYLPNRPPQPPPNRPLPNLLPRDAR